MTRDTADSAAQVDRHIEECDVCGDGEGVCLTGYLLVIDERRENSA